MRVCLLALGAERFELYAEPAPEPLDVPSPSDGRLRRWARHAGERWEALVVGARQRGGGGLSFGALRDRLICRLADRLSDEHTMRTLGRHTEASLLHPSTLSDAEARDALRASLSKSRRHHAVWFVVDALLFIVSAVLAPIPGPNAFAYFLAFRLVGHGQAWRGARRAAAIRWTLHSEPELSALEALTHRASADRAPRLQQIAARLNLPRLPAFFERVVA